MKEFTKGRKGNILGVMKGTNNLMLLKVREKNGTRQPFCHIDHKNMLFFFVKLKFHSLKGVLILRTCQGMELIQKILRVFSRTGFSKLGRGKTGL